MYSHASLVQRGGHRNEALLAELGLEQREHSFCRVDVSYGQTKRFGDAKAAAVDHAEEERKNLVADRTIHVRSACVRPFEKTRQLALGEDVRLVDRLPVFDEPLRKAPGGVSESKHVLRQHSHKANTPGMSVVGLPVSFLGPEHRRFLRQPVAPKSVLGAEAVEALQHLLGFVVPAPGRPLLQDEVQNERSEGAAVLRKRPIRRGHHRGTPRRGPVRSGAGFQGLSPDIRRWRTCSRVPESRR